MTSNATTSTVYELSTYLVWVRRELTWSMIIYIIVGNVGNICNCLVFLQKPLRSNSCSFYLMAASMVNIITVSYSVTLNIYTVDNPNSTTDSLIFCKLRMYLAHAALMLSRYLIVLACFDQACASSRRVRVRGFARLSIARRVTISSIFIWLLIPVHLPIMYTIQKNQCLMPGVYSLVYSIYSLVLAGFAPPLLMTLFSLITSRNLHRAHERVIAVNVNRNGIRQRDYNLTRMLFAQVLVYILTTLPYPINTFYSAVTVSLNKSTDRQAIESFLSFITGTLLIQINPTIPFYVYWSTSKAFRKEFKTTLNNIWKQFFLKHQVVPTVSGAIVLIRSKYITGDHVFRLTSTTTTRPGWNNNPTVPIS